MTLRCFCRDYFFVFFAVEGELELKELKTGTNLVQAHQFFKVWEYLDELVGRQRHIFSREGVNVSLADVLQDLEVVLKGGLELIEFLLILLLLWGHLLEVCLEMREPLRHVVLPGKVRLLNSNGG